MPEPDTLALMLTGIEFLLVKWNRCLAGRIPAS